MSILIKVVASLAIWGVSYALLRALWRVHEKFTSDAASLEKTAKAHRAANRDDFAERYTAGNYRKTALFSGGCMFLVVVGALFLTVLVIGAE